MNKEEIINAVLDSFANMIDRPMDYVYGYMDAVAALREYLDNAYV